MDLLLTKQDFKRFYIYDYYYEQKRVLQFSRKFLGPILIGLGMYLYASGSPIDIFFILICIFMGFFYTLKPFLFIMLKRMKDETITFEFKDKMLIVKDRLNKASFDLEKVIIHDNKLYYFIRLDNRQILFFPKDKLNEKALNNFSSFLDK